MFEEECSRPHAGQIRDRPPVAPPCRAQTAPSGLLPSPYFVDWKGGAPPYQPSYELARLLGAMSPGVKARFSGAQLAALDVAIVSTRPRPATHKLDFRASVPFFGRRYYVVLLGGRERRSRARIAGDGQDATWRMSVAYAVLFGSLASLAMTGTIVVLYLIKSLLGIDVFPDHSILHGLFF